METKHINDRLDPIATEAKTLNIQPARKSDAPRLQESQRLRVVEDPDVVSDRVMDDAALADVVDISAAKLPAIEGPVRSEFVLNPLSRRVVPYWRRRR